MCKLENDKLPDYSIPETFWTDSVSGLDKLTGMKSGDICVIPYFGGGLTYMYDGTKWVKIMYNDSTSNSVKAEYTDIECKCCGSHKFKRVNDESIVCEYCGNTMFIKRG